MNPDHLTRSQDQASAANVKAVMEWMLGIMGINVKLDDTMEPGEFRLMQQAVDDEILRKSAAEFGNESSYRY